MSTRPPSPSSSVRLRVTYRSPESLLGEFARSVGQGSVTLETPRAVPLGTRFVFEMHAAGMDAPVEVVGEVAHVAPRPGGRFHLTVRYGAGSDRTGLEAALQRIFAAYEHDPARRHPRIPLHVRAVEASPASPAFYVRDISRGGMGLEVDAPELPPMVRVGTPFLLEMELESGPLLLPGEVVWTASSPRMGAPVMAEFGVDFGPLPPDSARRLEALLAMEALPPGPWWARVSFGPEAEARRG